MDAFLKGVVISASIIFAIGAQNAFVLKQGLQKNHPFVISLTCLICDAIVITIGVFGVGHLIIQSPLIGVLFAAMGAFFLFAYSIQSACNVYRASRTLKVQAPLRPQKLKTTIAKTLAVTLLNPHFYLDSLMIIGSFSATLLPSEKLIFIIGCLLVSLVWFFSLSYGAGLLSTYFRKKTTWIMLNIFVAITMFVIGLELVQFTFFNLY